MQKQVERSTNEDDDGDEVWRAYRQKMLEKAGVWESWRCVPPQKSREKPLAEYLPGGDHYE